MTCATTVPSRAVARQYEARHEADVEKLNRMIACGQTALCRWRVLLEYFGEQVDWDRCGECDNCRRASDSPTAGIGRVA